MTLSTFLYVWEKPSLTGIHHRFKAKWNVNSFTHLCGFFANGIKFHRNKTCNAHNIFCFIT